MPRSRKSAIRQINDTATTPLHRAAVTWRSPGGHLVGSNRSSKIQPEYRGQFLEAMNEKMVKRCRDQSRVLYGRGAKAKARFRPSGARQDTTSIWQWKEPYPERHEGAKPPRMCLASKHLSLEPQQTNLKRRVGRANDNDERTEKA